MSFLYLCYDHLPIYLLVSIGLGVLLTNLVGVKSLFVDLIGGRCCPTEFKL